MTKTLLEPTLSELAKVVMPVHRTIEGGSRLRVTPLGS